MPEQLTKHPAVTLQVLRSADAQCGTGQPQAILTRCPAERFCKLPGGELCVYGLPEAHRMTQISAEEWRALAAPPAASTTSGGAPPAGGGEAPVLASGGAGLLVGLIAGYALARARRARAS